MLNLTITALTGIINGSVTNQRKLSNLFSSSKMSGANIRRNIAKSTPDNAMFRKVDKK